VAPKAPGEGSLLCESEIALLTLTPSEYVADPVLPSPARGEGATTSTARR
jgi:hypothetical protein